MKSSKKLPAGNANFHANPLSTRIVRNLTEIIYEQKVP